jgi:hypothetical protein
LKPIASFVRFKSIPVQTAIRATKTDALPFQRLLHSERRAKRGVSLFPAL